MDPPAKPPRASSSSLSEAEDNDRDDDFDDDSDDEDRPLASRLGAPTTRSVPGKTKKVTGKRSHGGKQGGGGKKAKKVHTLPSDDDRKPNGKPNGAAKGLNGHHKKVKEEKAEPTVDPQSTMRAPVPGAAARTEKISAVELRKGVIQIVPVESDGQPRSLVILTGLKTLFQKQLPKMPREYIARLVYDENSRGLAIIKQGYKVVGGICFRPFPHRGFAEIVFFATNSMDQEKVSHFTDPFFLS